MLSNKFDRKQRVIQSPSTCLLSEALLQESLSEGELETESLDDGLLALKEEATEGRASALSILPEVLDLILPCWV